MPERCQLNIRLDGFKELLEEARQQASEQNTSLNQWMIAAIQEKLARPSATPVSATPPQNIQDMIDDSLSDRISQLNTQIAERFTNIDKFLGICSVGTLDTTLDAVLDKKLESSMPSTVLDNTLDIQQDEPPQEHQGEDTSTVLDKVLDIQQEEDTSIVLDKVLDIPQEPQEPTQPKTVEHPDAIAIMRELRKTKASWGVIATRLTEDGFIMSGKSGEPVLITHRNISPFAKSKGID